MIYMCEMNEKTISCLPLRLNFLGSPHQAVGSAFEPELDFALSICTVMGAFPEYRLLYSRYRF